MENTDKILVKADEACHMLGLGRSTVYALMQSGELPTIRIGRSVRINVKHLRDWVERQTTTSDQRPAA